MCLHIFILQPITWIRDQNSTVAVSQNIRICKVSFYLFSLVDVTLHYMTFIWQALLFKAVSVYQRSLEQLQHTSLIRYNTNFFTVIHSHEHIMSSSHSEHCSDLNYYYSLCGQGTTTSYNNKTMIRGAISAVCSCETVVKLFLKGFTILEGIW